MENIVSRLNTIADIMEILSEKDRTKFIESNKDSINQINILLDGMEKFLSNFTIPMGKIIRERVLVKNLFYFYWILREKIDSMTDEELVEFGGN